MGFKNVAVNLKARGVAAVFCVWLICFSAVAIFAKGLISYLALGCLGAWGALMLASLDSRLR